MTPRCGPVTNIVGKNWREHKPVHVPLSPCIFCAEEMPKRKGESWPAYKERRYCGPPCVFAHRKVLNAEREAAVPTRHCLMCDEALVRKDRISLSKFSSRRFCSPVCSHEYSKGTAVGGYEGGRLKPIDRGKESRLYGGETTDAYRVGFIRTVEPFTRGSHANSAAPS